MAEQKRKPGAPKAYTPDQLRTAVNRYFNSITRTVQMTEKVETGELDEYGHKVYENRPILNKLGKPAEKTEYLAPPTVGGLCIALKIHRSTWANYCNDPEYFDTTTHAQGLMLAWREEQLMTRDKTKGIEFDLQNNWGYSTKAQVEVTGGIEDYLEKLAQQGDGEQSF